MNVGEEEERRADVTGMLNYGFANYSSVVLKRKDEMLGKERIEIFDREVEVYLKSDYKELVKKGSNVPEYSYEIRLNSISGSIMANDVVGSLLVKNNNELIKELEVVVHENYKKVSFWHVWANNIRRLFGVK